MPSSPRQRRQNEVQQQVRDDPANALGIIEEANGRECPYAWHLKRYQTQYLPVEVERVVPVTEYVDRLVPHPVPDPAVEQQLLRAQEELDLLRRALPKKQGEDDARQQDKHSLKVLNAKLLAKLAKKDEQIQDLQTALLRNFGLAKELSDQSCPEIVETRKDQLRLLQSKVVALQEVLRHKEEYIQEVTQAMIDSSTGVLKIQRETQELLQAERLENNAAWDQARALEKRTASLEKEVTLMAQLRSQLKESNAAREDMRQQLEDKDDVIDALEEQFRQTTFDEAADLSRDEVLVRMTQLRFKIGLKNAQALKQNGEIFKLRAQATRQSEDYARLEVECEERRAECQKLRQKVDSLKVQVAGVRRDLLSASSPVRPIIMPQPIYDDTRRLLEAPTAPRTRPLTEQDIVAAFSLFDASVQGELPGWDMPLFLRCLGFTSEDTFVNRLTAEYRKHHGTLSLEEFRDVLLEVQREYTPMKMSAESLLGQWQEASRRRVEASRAREKKNRGLLVEDSGSESEEDVHRNVTAVSIRAAPMVSGDIEDSFGLFDHEQCGEVDRKLAGTFIHALGLVRTTADLEALNVIIFKEFSGTLNIDEWTDLVQYCQGVQPNFVRRRVLEHKPPKQGLYPKPFPKAGRSHPLSEREMEAAFRLFDVDRSGLLPGHQIPTYLSCLGLVCSGPEFTALLVTQYKADLTQKVGFSYFCRMVRFVQEHLDFFAPSPRKPRVRTKGSEAQEARREGPIGAPLPRNLAVGLGGPSRSMNSSRAPPSRPNTAVYSPRTRRPGEYPPWMVPSVVPAQVEAIERETPGGASAVRSPEDLAVPVASPELESLRFAPSAEPNDFTPREEARAVGGRPDVGAGPAGHHRRALEQSDVLRTFNFYAQHFNCPQVSMVTGSKALALQHVVLAVRSLGFTEVTRRFLEQVWPYERKRDAVQSQGGGAGDELILDESEFVRLVKNVERYGTKRDADQAALPKSVNRHLPGGALRAQDIDWVFQLLDDDGKGFLTGKDFRTMLTLLGFTLQDEPEIQNVLVVYDTHRPSRSSREHNIFEASDCVEVLRRLTAKPLSNMSREALQPSTSWLC